MYQYCFSIWSFLSVRSRTDTHPTWYDPFLIYEVLVRGDARQPRRDCVRQTKSFIDASSLYLRSAGVSFSVRVDPYQIWHIFENVEAVRERLSHWHDLLEFFVQPFPYTVGYDDIKGRNRQRSCCCLRASTEENHSLTQKALWRLLLCW